MSFELCCKIILYDVPVFFPIRIFGKEKILPVYI